MTNFNPINNTRAYRQISDDERAIMRFLFSEGIRFEELRSDDYGTPYYISHVKGLFEMDVVYQVREADHEKATQLLKARSDRTSEQASDQNLVIVVDDEDKSSEDMETTTEYELNAFLRDQKGVQFVFCRCLPQPPLLARF